MSNCWFYGDIRSGNPEVSGSNHDVVVSLPNRQATEFVVDCGLFQEREHENLNNVLQFSPENIEFVLVTHNHVDHIGRLPYMVKNGFKGPIYTTKETSLLLPLALEDSYKVLRDGAKRKNKKVLYNEADVLKTEALIEPVDYNETKRINDYTKVTFLKNGHLVGAALILVQIEYPGYEDINILFTGDYNNKNIFFDVPDIPEWILELPLTVVMESTYGYMNSTDITKVFKDNILNRINNNGTVIAPVFSLGRAQEILYEIKCMQENGELSRDVPIYFDGKLAIKYTNLYLQHNALEIKEEMKNFLPSNLTFVDKVTRPQILEDEGQKIILTTSGMGSYGPAHTYIPKYISRDNTLIHFTGYTSENTLGGRLKKTAKGDVVEVGGIVARKRADVEYTTEYSAHAKADEMIDFLKQFKNLKLVLVNHGQCQVKKDFAKRIVNEVDPKCVGILGEEYAFRFNAYGLQKTLLTEIK